MKKNISLMLVLAIILSIISLPVPASAAAEDNQYKYRVYVCTTDDDSSGQLSIYKTHILFRFANPEYPKKGDVLVVKDEEFTDLSKNTEDRKDYTFPYPPWALYSAAVYNNTRDAVQIKWFKVYYEKSKDNWVELINLTPENGKWLSNKNGDGTQLWATRSNDEVSRRITSIDNFISGLGNGQQIYLKETGESGTQAFQWSGNYTDQYGTRKYYQGDGPLIFNAKITADGNSKKDVASTYLGDKTNNNTPPISNVKDDKGINVGIELNKEQLLASMKTNKHDRLDITFTLRAPSDYYAYFPKESLLPETTITITRTNFSFGKPRIVEKDNSYFIAEEQQYYFNSNPANGKDDIIIRLPVLNKSHYSAEAVANYIATNKNKQTFRLDYSREGGAGSKTISANPKEIKYVKDGNDHCIDLYYNRPENTSDNGVQFVLNVKAQVNLNERTYTMNTVGEEVENGEIVYNNLSKFRIDTKPLDLNAFTDSGWDVAATTYAKSREISFRINPGTDTPYTHTNERTASNSGNILVELVKAGTTSKVKEPATLGYAENAKYTASLGSVSAEGEYDLIVSAYDKAGNFSKVTHRMLLDNKPPEVSRRQYTVQNTGDTRQEAFEFNISDASGTGKLYYSFVPEGGEPESADAQKATGAFNSSFNKWYFIDQNDTNGTTALLGVAKNDIFKGELRYYAEDAFGNRTKETAMPLVINNVFAECELHYEIPGYAPKDHNITFTSPQLTDVYYQWIDNNGRAVTPEIKYTNGVNPGSGEQKDSNGRRVELDGTYKLRYYAKTSERTSAKMEQLFTFDRSAPKISVTVKGLSAQKEIRLNHTIGISIEEKSAISGGNYKIVSADNAEDVKLTDELEINNGMVDFEVETINLTTGAYKMVVTATDVNGYKGTAESDVFCIRNTSPTIENIQFSTDKKINDSYLVSHYTYSVSFDVSEPDAVALSQFGARQIIMVRTSSNGEDYGEWQNVGNYNNTVTNITSYPSVALQQGDNTVYIQTAITVSGKQPSDSNIVTLPPIKIFYDIVGPDYQLIFDNEEPTTGNVTGSVILEDAMTDSEDMRLVSEDENIEISEPQINPYTGKIGFFPITVKNNVNTFIYAYDMAGNGTAIPIVVNCIDREAPAVAITQKEEVQSGERQDVTLTLKVDGAVNQLTRYTLVPASEANEWENNPTYENGNNILVSSTHTEDNIQTSTLRIAGLTGDYRLGVYAVDALGNEAHTLCEEVISPVDVDVTMSEPVMPEKVMYTAFVEVEFNVPLYVLPQDKIVTQVEGDKEPIEEVNKSLAVDYADRFKTDYSLPAGENGTYTLYASDELRRSYVFTVDVEGVVFPENPPLRLKVIGSDEDLSYYEVLDQTKKHPEDKAHLVYLELSVDTEQYPNISLCDISYVEGEEPDFFSTGWYEGEPGEPVTARHEAIMPYRNEFTEIEYTSMAFSCSPLARHNPKYLEVMVREYSEMPSEENPTGVFVETKERFEISCLDSTGPTYSVSYDKGATRFDVPVSITASDSETEMKRLGYLFVPIKYGDVLYQQPYEPDPRYTDEYLLEFRYEDGRYVLYADNSVNIPGFWDFDDNILGSGTEGEHFLNHIREENQNAMSVLANPDNFTFVDYPEGVPLGNITVPVSENGVIFLWAENGVGMKNMVGLGFLGNDVIPPIYIDNIIDVHDLSENDYTVKYYRQAWDGSWEEIQEGDKYKTAKAVIELKDSSNTRGAFIENNGGSFERTLSAFSNSFTFNIVDKYGFRNSVPVSLNEFDLTGGTIDYSLSETKKTNRDIELNIFVTDESGIGRVQLIKDGEPLSITDLGSGNYKATVTENGVYVIDACDTSGNTFSKNVSISNINKVAPTATITKSTDEWTGKDVTVSLTFSKPNVTISKVELTQTSGENILRESDIIVSEKNNTIRFTKNGSISVTCTDDYGNEWADVITVTNIYKAPPTLEPVVSTDAVVTFKQQEDALGHSIDPYRELGDLFVFFRGATVTADEAQYKITENGTYTFKVFDKAGLTQNIECVIDCIDESAPKITRISWSYDYTPYGEGDTQTRTASITPNTEAGYIVAEDENNPVTNNDVLVSVETEKDTTFFGGNGEKTKEHNKVYSDNGLYSFNLRGDNGMISSYGAGIYLIDKTPPQIKFEGSTDLMYIEGRAESYHKQDLLDFTATDRGEDLTDRVVIDYGSFNPDDFAANTFDKSISYPIIYKVYDKAGNYTEKTRIVRLIGMYDTIPFINGLLPDSGGNISVSGNEFNVSFMNLGGNAYVRYAPGRYTLGQMKTKGTMINSQTAEFSVKGLQEGWYTVYIQTDKRDYFVLYVYVEG